MRGTRLWILIVVLLTLITLAIMVGAGFYYVISRPPAIERDTVVEVTLSGMVSELPPEDPFTILLGSRVQNLWDLRRTFRAAAEDQRVTAIYLKIHPLMASWAQIEELREFLLSFRSSGKQVHVFLAVDMATERELYLASAANRVILNPTAGILMNGLMAEVFFMKRTMEKLGIRPQFIQFKEYKNPEVYSRESMTPEFREMLHSILSDLQSRFIRAIAEDRNIDEVRLKQLIDIGILSARQALEEGLLDDVGYEHQIRESLQTATGATRYHATTVSEYLNSVSVPSPG